MFYYLYNYLSKFKLNLEKLEKILLMRFHIYCSSSNLQYDTDEFNNYDRLAQLLMSIVVTDVPLYTDLFLKGETKIFLNKLKNKECSEVKEELFTLLENLNSLSQREEFKKSNENNEELLKLSCNIIETVIDNCFHIFKNTHSEKCIEMKMVLPFTFLLDLVAKREVEVNHGKAHVPCGKWKEVLSVVFKSFLLLEIKLFDMCRALRNVIYEHEDDRLRQIIKRVGNVLNGSSRQKGIQVVRASDIDILTQYYPPCMANLHQILMRTHRLSYESRYQYTLFLRDIGVPVHENISFWENEYTKPYNGSSCSHEWKEKQNRYKYQIEHVYGLIGNRELKSSHSCEKFIGVLQMKMDGGCPFKHLTTDELRQSIPKSVLEVPDVEEVFRYKSCNMPQNACGAYLLCQQKAFINRNRKLRDGRCRVSCVSHVISPLQYYNIARNTVES